MALGVCWPGRAPSCDSPSPRRAASGPSGHPVGLWPGPGRRAEGRGPGLRALLPPDRRRGKRGWIRSAGTGKGPCLLTRTLESTQTAGVSHPGAAVANLESPRALPRGRLPPGPADPEEAAPLRDLSGSRQSGGGVCTPAPDHLTAGGRRGAEGRGAREEVTRVTFPPLPQSDFSATRKLPDRCHSNAENCVFRSCPLA